MNMKKLKLDLDQVKEIVGRLYNITGTITPLPGELDLNFSVKTQTGKYILKIASPEKCELDFLYFQNNILKHLNINFKGVNVLENQQESLEELEKLIAFNTKLAQRKYDSI